ncbi:uncharacterized protein TNCV_2943611 [Trichonephila clavipes]|nr:uncharacterized protein TNCV_2943611 [Trichonephila clavipes]
MAQLAPHEKVRDSTGTLLGNGVVYQTKTFIFVAVGSQFFRQGGVPGMIHRDAHHLGIAAIAGNWGNGEFDGNWLALVVKHVGMSNINGLA